MQMDFYCEFPKEGLEKLKLINFPSRIFIAAHSVEEFQKFEKRAKKLNKKITCCYWPLVKGPYWISPFSNKKDLIELFNELEKTKTPLLIDLEPPILNKKLFLKNLFNFKKNKNLIKKFLERNKKRITTAQHPLVNSRLMRLLGLDYNINYEKSLMYYSSMISKLLSKKIKENLIKIKNKENYSIGLGTLAKGILGNEPLLSSENLEKDLNFFRRTGFNRVIIFRLGGLNKEYIEVIKRFLN